MFPLSTVYDNENYEQVAKSLKALTREINIKTLKPLARSIKIEILKPLIREIIMKILKPLFAYHDLLAGVASAKQSPRTRRKIY